eukprot:7632793-Pyramimonas_sp.AAC.1
MGTGRNNGVILFHEREYFKGAAVPRQRTRAGRRAKDAASGSAKGFPGVCVEVCLRAGCQSFLWIMS